MANDRGRCLVIAEAGVNHNGSTDLAHKLIDAAADAGADIVKFQTFVAANLASRSAGKAAYQIRETGGDQSQLEMLQALELSRTTHRELMQHCQEREIEFLSSPFDIASLEFLVALGVRRLKLGSGELTNAPLLIAAGRTGLPVILSTGMSSLGDVEQALGAIALGYSSAPLPQPGPTRKDFALSWANPRLRSLLHEKVMLLHCTTDYPAPVNEVNLRAMGTMGLAFELPCGYSDHTPGIVISLAAVALGASVIEKHFTLDRSLPGPDHKASLLPAELSALVEGVREVEAALGSAVKMPSDAEWANQLVARKSLVAAHSIPKDAVIAPDDIQCKRPGGGVSPMSYWEVVGTRARQDFAADDQIVF